jgi:hypothetical protein
MSEADEREGNGPDPFNGESPFSTEKLAEFADWLRAAANQLGLRDWDVSVSKKLPDSNATAQTYLRTDAPEMVVALSKGFFDWTEPYRRQVLVHELLHAHFHGLSKYARDAVEGELGKRWEDLFGMTVSNHEEMSVDRLARAIAPMFPESPAEP